MHLLARNGSRRDGLHQTVRDMYRQREDSSRNPASTRSPSQTMDQNRYGFLPRWFRTEILIVADYFSKFHLPCRIDPHQKTLRYLRDLFLTEGVPAVIMTDNGPPFNGEEFRRFAREFDFKHQTSSPHFHQSMDSSRQWSRKSKPPTRKRTDLRTLKREPCYSYATPRSQKIYHPRQKSCMDGPHKELSCPDDTDPSTSRKSAADS